MIPSFVAFLLQLLIAVSGGMLGVDDFGRELTSPPDQSRAIHHCLAEHWKSGPGMSDGLLAGNIGTDCSVSEASGTGVASLYQFLSDIRHDAHITIVHSGPVPETYKGMNGIRYDVTAVYPNGSDPITVREDIHLASDQRGRLVFDTMSTQVSSSGLAGYLRKMDALLEVIASSSEAPKYLLKLDANLAVEKPAWIPISVAIKQARDIGAKQFQKTRDSVIGPIKDHL
jgi:hypothetical protein